MLDKYPQDLKLVYKNFPLASHRFARKAATAALAANTQGKFWEFHKKLFAHYQGLNDAKIREIAMELGLDMERFERDMNGRALQRLVIRDMRDGQKAGVRRIPTIFINGKLVKNRTPQVLERMIQAELKKRK